MKRISALAKVLEKAARGRGAQVLAAQAGISDEEAVKRFLWPRGDDLYWTLRLAGGWELLGGDKNPLIGEVRDRLYALGEAHENLALFLCDHAVGLDCDSCEARKAVREEFCLLGFFEDEIEALLTDPWNAVAQLNKTTTDIRGWMHAFRANGRRSLASIVVAELVASFFDQALFAAEAANDTQTSALLRVKFARSGTVPANSYCRAVEEALIALGVRTSPTPDHPKGVLGGGWRRAVQDVCAIRETLSATVESGSKPQ